LLSLSASAAAAQSWNLDLQVGKMRAALDPIGPLTEHGVLGLRFERPGTALRLSTGAPVSGIRPIWGSIAAWQRLALHHKGWLAGLDLTGNGLLQQQGDPGAPSVPGLLDPGGANGASPGGHAFAGQVLPLVGFEGERLSLTARAGVSYYRSSLGGESRSRTVGLGDVQLWLQPARAITLVPSIRHYRAADERSTFAGVTVALTGARVGAWGSVGEWLTAPSGTPVSWTVGASWKLHRLATLNASVRRDSFDPLYQSPSQTSWNAGVSIPLSRVPTARAPVPDRYRKGVATIRLPASAMPRAERLAIAGDFNRWKAAPMERSGDAWVYQVTVPPGIYHYAFVDQNGKWFVPEGTPGRREDGMGGHVAVLVVEPEE
jgi:hypothetical protein